MAKILGAAFGLPTIVLTAALIAVVGFWLLVMCRAVAQGVFDADVDAEALGVGGVPVAVAGSVFIAVGWVIDLSGMVLLGRARLAGLWSFLLSVALLAGALALSWRVTRRLVGRMARRSGAFRRGSRHGAAPDPHPSRSAA